MTRADSGSTKSAPTKALVRVSFIEKTEVLFGDGAQGSHPQKPGINIWIGIRTCGLIGHLALRTT
jgi:hypothetical protein